MLSSRLGAVNLVYQFGENSLKYSSIPAGAELGPAQPQLVFLFVVVYNFPPNLIIFVLGGYQNPVNRAFNQEPGSSLDYKMMEPGSMNIFH